MSEKLVLFAKAVLTLDRARPLEDGFVLLKGSRILRVGRRSELHLPSSLRALDLGRTVLMPGLINAHCHLDFTGLKGRMPYKGDFGDWLRRMGRWTRGASPSDFRESVRKGIRESLAHGTTTICDTATSWESCRLLERSGSRAFAFLEVLDVTEPSAEAYWKAFTERSRALSRQVPSGDLFRWGLSPHTPYTVSKETLDAARRLLDSHRALPTSIHVAESREEGRFFRSGTGPVARMVRKLHPDWSFPRHTTPLRYLNANGWLPKLDLGVHLNVVDARDLELLARNRVTVVHCPGSHAFFRHPPFPFDRMRRSKIPVCLGTDSLASNRSLSLFREMRLFREAHPRVPAREILAMATVRPARALGMGGELGRIKPGYLADLIGVPLREGGTGGELEDRVLDHRGPVTFSMVHGEPRLRLT